jgi:signal transduction histidine kinase
MSAGDSDGHAKGDHASRLVGVLAGLAGVALVGLLDWMTGTEISLSILYLLPIGLTVWFAGQAAGVAVSLLAAGVWLTLDLQGGSLYSHPVIPYWNALVRLGFFLLTTFLLSRVRFLTTNLEAIIKERTAALEAEIAQRRQAEREVAEISHQEQERIAHEVHDHLGTYLAGLAFRAKVLAESLERHALPEADDARQLVAFVNEAGSQARNLARLLAPVDATAGGLAAGLSRLGAELESLFGITCPVEGAKDLPPLTDEQGRQLYRIAQEAARNAVQHAKAQLVEITLGREQDDLKLVVRNDGLPWSPSDAPRDGLGLRIMRYRAGILGGTLTLEAEPGGRTAVVCRVPLQFDSTLCAQSSSDPAPLGYEQDSRPGGG